MSALKPGKEEKTSRASAPEYLVAPLGLELHQRQRAEGFDLVPFFDFACILLLFGLIGSGLIFSPGFTVELPESRSNELSGLNVTAVLTLRPNMILFNGARQQRSGLERALRNYLLERGPSGLPSESPVLLVKLDRNVSVAQFLEISEMARASGFVRVQIAAEPPGSRAHDSMIRSEGGGRGW